MSEERKVDVLLATVAVIVAGVALGLDDVGARNIHSSPYKKLILR
jgi:hypothetical protein